MSGLQYLNIKAYRVAWRLRGLPLEDCFEDPMAERLRCAGCGAPAGYFCLTAEGDFWVNRLTCKGIIGSQNPRTLLAFAKGAEEIQKREAAEKEKRI